MKNRYLINFILALIILSSVIYYGFKINYPNNLLTLEVIDERLEKHQKINVKLQHIKPTQNLNVLLSTLFLDIKTQQSLLYIQQDNNKTSLYHAILINDGMTGDDSIRAYRYNIFIEKKTTSFWKIQELKLSWRCWQGRGHQNFDIKPCI